MKKTFRFVGLMMMAVLSYGMTACGGDDGDDNGGIDTSPISLSSGKDKTIQGADTITSSNKFVAYANKNVVHGWHVGEATLVVNGKSSISISVLPNYHLYNDPICEWGCSMDYVKKNQKQGTLNSKSNDTVLAYDNAGGATLLAYTFENGKLKGVVAMVSTNHTSTLGDYLAERYLMIPLYEGENTYFAGMDGLEKESAKTFVYMDLYNTSTWSIVYGSTASLSTRSNVKNEEVTTIKEMLRSFLTK